MMTYEQYLLGKLAEELSEAAKDALKAQQFGLEEGLSEEPSNSEKLHIELNHVTAVVEMLKNIGFTTFHDESIIQAKKEAVCEYLGYSANLGKVQL